MNITNKGLVSEIFKYNKTKAKQTSRRLGKGYEQEIHRRGTCIVKKQWKKKPMKILTSLTKKNAKNTKWGISYSSDWETF